MRISVLVLAAAMAVSAVGAHATVYTVGAVANSATGGTGLPTITLTTGQNFTVSASLTDLWSAGPLPRWSNANGLVGDLYATGADESGQPTGTLIGVNFGLHTQNSLSAPFGSLVGEIGGIYQLLGASFSGPAWNTGTLNLFYWDSNNFDNSGTVAVSVTGVPEPASWAMLIAGFGLVGAVARRRAALA